MRRAWADRLAESAAAAFLELTARALPGGVDPDHRPAAAQTPWRPVLVGDVALLRGLRHAAQYACRSGRRLLDRVMTGANSPAASTDNGSRSPADGAGWTDHAADTRRKAPPH